MAHWWRIHLQMQEMQEPLIWPMGGEDPICHRTAKPHASQLLSQHFRACAPQQEKPPQGEALKPQQSSLRPLQLDPAQPKIKENYFFLKKLGSKKKKICWASKRATLKLDKIHEEVSLQNKVANRLQWKHPQTQKWWLCCLDGSISQVSLRQEEISWKTW